MRSAACYVRAARCCSRRAASKRSRSIEEHPDVAAVLADLHMPGLPGAELLARVAQMRPHCRRAVVTGFPESEELITAINAGHLHYVITKPWKLTDLLQVVDQLDPHVQARARQQPAARRAARRQQPAARARAHPRGAALRARPRDLGGDRAARADGQSARRADAARSADRPLHAPRVPGAPARGGRARACATASRCRC